jgi:pyruvate/2-oxoglutarate dehydrogenase complex dihydrolipoamide dehydrogenase (E3) component
MNLLNVALQVIQETLTRVSGVSVDLPKMLKSKEKSVKQLTGGIEFLFKKNKVLEE